MGLFSSDNRDKPNALNTPVADQHAALAAWNAKHNPPAGSRHSPRGMRITDAGRAYLDGLNDGRKNGGK